MNRQRVYKQQVDDLHVGGIVIKAGTGFWRGQMARGWYLPGGRFTSSRLEALETARRLNDLLEASR